VVRGPCSAKTERSNGNHGYIKRVFDTVSLHVFFSSVREKKGEAVIAPKEMLHKL
jgi:hypothetical protein